MEELISSEKWSEITRLEKKLSSSWENNQVFFSLIIDHAELNDLEISLAKINSHVKEKKKSELLPELEISQRLIQNLWQQEKLSWQNVF